MAELCTPEYTAEVTGGRGYTVMIPRFFGDEARQMNKFYGTLGAHLTKYFERLCDGGRRCCRSSFEVSPQGGDVVVCVRTACRERGRRIAEKRLSHTWHSVGGVWLLSRGRRQNK